MPQRVLNVAEKNDAAKELAKIMSRGRFQRVSYHTRAVACYEILTIYEHYCTYSERAIRNLIRFTSSRLTY